MDNIPSKFDTPDGNLYEPTAVKTAPAPPVREVLRSITLILIGLALLAAQWVSLFLLATTTGQLSLGPAIAQPAPYAATDSVSITTVEAKYDIVLATQGQMPASLNPAHVDSSWSEGELRRIDTALSGLPSAMYARINGQPLTIFLGYMVGIPGDVPGGLCTDSCGGFFAPGYGNGSGVVGFSETLFVRASASFDRQALAHELTHRLYRLVAGKLAGPLAKLMPAVLASENDKNPGVARAADIVKDYARSNVSSDPHDNPAEAVAEISEIYTQGPADFLTSFGPVLDGAVYLDSPADPDTALAAAYPKAERLYELWRNTVFAGYSYDDNGLLVDGDASAL